MITTPPRLSARARAVIDDFGTQPGVTADEFDCLRAAIYSSPELAHSFDRAVTHGDLRRLQPLPSSSSAGGIYEAGSRAISLPLSKLFRSTLNEATFVLGHEVQHAINRSTTSRADRSFLHELDRSARHDRDYTGAVSRVIQVHRHDEASANIAGWNALAGRLRHFHTEVTLEMMRIAARGRTTDFIQRDPGSRALRPRNSLTIMSDGQIDPTPENVEAIAQTYVDRSPHRTRLGHNGNSDYANYYGAWAVGVAAQIHAAHHSDDRNHAMRVDLQHLRLSRDLLEQNGVDLGPSARSIPLVDGSTFPPSEQLLHHTATSHRFVPVVETTTSRNRSLSAVQLARLGFAGRAVPRIAARTSTSIRPRRAAKQTVQTGRSGGARE